MANLAWRDGRARVQFYQADGRRVSVQIGPVSERIAERVKVHVENIIDAKRFAVPVDNSTAAWLLEIDDEFHSRLDAVGLVTPRRRATIGEWMAQYIASRTDVKPNTLTNFRQVQRRCLAIIPTCTPLDKVTHDAAKNYAETLARRYSEATAGKDVKTCRQFFAAAAKAGLIDDNPFAEIPTGSQANPSRTRFIDRATIETLLASTDNLRWHALIVLARYGGLRCPSEVCNLRWTDIDWKRGRFVVRQNKTASRTVPLFPEIRRVLMRLDRSGEFVIDRPTGKASYFGDRFKRMIERAGLTPWPRVWHNLRASRETELVAQFPLHVVATWLGNSAMIAHRHYLSVTENDYRTAAG